MVLLKQTKQALGIRLNPGGNGVPVGRANHMLERRDLKIIFYINCHRIYDSRFHSRLFSVGEM
jgi:hypothetical protein